jgi:RNA polymerase sigma-70 factor, ECF subfamily
MLFSRTEAELVEAAKAGDRAAFAELLRPVYDDAVRLAIGMLHDGAQAEDAVQEAALHALKKISNLREGSSLRPWFLGIVANRCRTMKRARWWSVVSLDSQRLESGPVDVASALDLRRGLMRLGHDERLVLVLRYYLDMPYEEIATTLGTSTTGHESGSSGRCTACGRSCRSRGLRCDGQAIRGGRTQPFGTVP